MVGQAATNRLVGNTVEPRVACRASPLVHPRSGSQDELPPERNLTILAIPKADAIGLGATSVIRGSWRRAYRRLPASHSFEAEAS